MSKLQGRINELDRVTVDIGNAENNVETLIEQLACHEAQIDMARDDIEELKSRKTNLERIILQEIKKPKAVIKGEAKQAAKQAAKEETKPEEKTKKRKTTSKKRTTRRS